MLHFFADAMVASVQLNYDATETLRRPFNRAGPVIALIHNPVRLLPAGQRSPGETQASAVQTGPFASAQNDYQ